MDDPIPNHGARSANRPFAIADPGMAAALLAGRKTQMRVLVHSPLAQVAPGERIAVREACIPGRYVAGQVYSTSPANATFVIFPDGWRQHSDGSVKRGRRPTDPDHLWIPAIQMPDWAGRATLIIERVRTERLQRISRRDVRAEGAVPLLGGLLWRWPPPMPGRYLTASRAFAHYWNVRHAMPGERWEDDPPVVVLGFRVELCSR
ncbi:hypothetical protein [Sphingobium nicotianae]|uniref:ASCH domain-containing protein n=1 Tax=Sphingobium nicotianae TaxID=2782607 RepID=A0A9X1AJA8_9SPHN|nr:hypothetical protein [Sphingobium nicotianae]MBT2185370.1 hypothetical protein [Sphingobium nicotianae]